MFRVYSVYVQDMFRVCSEYVQCSSGYVQGLFRVCSEYVQGMFMTGPCNDGDEGRACRGWRGGIG